MGCTATISSWPPGPTRGSESDPAESARERRAAGVHARAPARSALSPRASPARPWRRERARVHPRRRLLLHLLSVSRGRGLPMGGRGGSPESALAASLASRRRRGPDLAAQGHAALAA